MTLNKFHFDMKILKREQDPNMIYILVEHFSTIMKFTGCTHCSKQIFHHKFHFVREHYAKRCNEL